jgi:hypothetical protein
MTPIDIATRARLLARALLPAGFSGALRRSEFVTLDVEHLTFDAARDLLVMIARSKADQEQHRALVAAPTPGRRCAARCGRCGPMWRLAPGAGGLSFDSCAAAIISPIGGSQPESVALIVTCSAHAAGARPSSCRAIPCARAMPPRGSSRR